MHAKKNDQKAKYDTPQRNKEAFEEDHLAYNFEYQTDEQQKGNSGNRNSLQLK